MTHANKVGLLVNGNPVNSTNPLPIDGSITTSAGANELTQYITQAIIVDTGDSNLTYFCKEKNDGTWLFIEFDETSGLIKTFANISNNATMTDYNTAFASRESLTYEKLEDLSGL